MGINDFVSAEEMAIPLPGFEYKLFSEKQDLRENQWNLFGTDFEAILKIDKMYVLSGFGIFSFSDIKFGAFEKVDVSSVNLACWNLAVPLKFGELICVPVFLGGNVNADFTINDLLPVELRTDKFFNYGLFSSYKNNYFLFFKGDFLPDVDLGMKIFQKSNFDLYGLLYLGNYRTDRWTFNPCAGYFKIDGNVDLDYSSSFLLRIFDYFYFETDLNLDVFFAGCKSGVSVDNFYFSGLIGAANIPLVSGEGMWKYKFPNSMKYFVKNLSSASEFDYDLLKTLGALYLDFNAEWKIPKMENLSVCFSKSFLLPFGFEEPCAGMIRDYYSGFTKQDYFNLFLKGIKLGIAFEI